VEMNVSKIRILGNSKNKIIHTNYTHFSCSFFLRPFFCVFLPSFMSSCLSSVVTSSAVSSVSL
jgi:hypothetical protein